jgi:hypothetical protein
MTLDWVFAQRGAVARWAALAVGLVAVSGCGSADDSSPRETAEDPAQILGHPVAFREALELHDVEFDGTRFVAVGVSGTFDAADSPGLTLGARSLALASTDGRNWERIYESAAGPILDVAFGHGRWVALGNGSWATESFQVVRAALVLTSTGGEIWNVERTPTEGGLASVIAGESGFIATSRSSIWKSDSGASWIEREVPASLTLPLDGLAQSGGITIAHSAGDIWRSVDDGATWQEVPRFGESAGLPDYLRGFWPTPEGFAGTSQVPGREMLDVSSSDGLNWARIPREGSERALAVLQVVSAGSVELRRTDAFESQIDVKQPDGSWGPTLAARVHSLTYGDGLFVAVGPQGAYWSVDGHSWDKGTVY